MSRLLKRLEGHLAGAPGGPGPGNAMTPPPAPPPKTHQEDPCLVRREVLDLDLGLLKALLGCTRKAGGLPPVLRAMLRRSPQEGHRGALLFDVEATGLSRGAGTLVFLLGMVRLGPDAVVLEQYFLRTLGLEAQLLQAFLDQLESRPLLISYNGKSYDLAVLRNRLIINGLLPAPEAEPRTLPHLDLLHTGRALWKGTLTNHRLGTLEGELLGLARGPGELEGALMPAAWFSWLNTRDEASLEAMMEHNRQDLVSCLLLAQRALEELLHSSSRPVAHNAANLLAKARLWGPAGALAVGLGAEGLAKTSLRAWLRAGPG